MTDDSNLTSPTVVLELVSAQWITMSEKQEKKRQSETTLSPNCRYWRDSPEKSCTAVQEMRPL